MTVLSKPLKTAVNQKTSSTKDTEDDNVWDYGTKHFTYGSKPTVQEIARAKRVGGKTKLRCDASLVGFLKVVVVVESEEFLAKKYPEFAGALRKERAKKERAASSLLSSLEAAKLIGLLMGMYKDDEEMERHGKILFLISLLVDSHSTQ
ncbi:hypothetical protein PRIPAC_72326 [Pristionchus pacificus]|uniref:Uncharacterized protein n=1 Tax=Pristionchus pacificus TaxID=54126 RepID=A0A2A6B4Z2_PRIPA|nr:hypothetical protein PRIPAC_72326 [Pristionchus pacificus]|eukprot:PDM60947.1 hypothetical protein PRIPAC_54753 [Pristionchus pacificus]